MRVISGTLKGRNIEGFNLDGTRPTMDRVKESLFASIQNYIEGATVLDLFAGSGNLGIEAISNGSDFVYFCDKNSEAVKVINKNLDNFKIKDKILLGLGFLLPFGMTSAILYLSFTPVRNLHIYGYQARYIFPILPLLLCCISNNKIKCTKSENRNMNIAIISCVFLVIGLLQLTSI